MDWDVTEMAHSQDGCALQTTAGETIDFVTPFPRRGK